MANHRGGSGNFAEDRERASEAGKKGGQHSGGNFKTDPPPVTVKATTSRANQ